MADVSIMITAKDNYSAAINKMKNAQTAFRNDANALNKELTALNNNKVTLKVDLEQANNRLKETKKAYAEFGDEIMRSQMLEAQAN